MPSGAAKHCWVEEQISALVLLEGSEPLPLWRGAGDLGDVLLESHTSSLGTPVGVRV